MADIDVVKKRTNVWPWVIGILLLAVLLWFLIPMMGGTDTSDAPLSWHQADAATAAVVT